MDKAPTRLKARATLSPITWVTTAMSTDNSTSVVGNEVAIGWLLRVRRYTQATAPPKTKDKTRRTSTSIGETVGPVANGDFRNSGIWPWVTQWVGAKPQGHLPDQEPRLPDGISRGA